MTYLDPNRTVLADGRQSQPALDIARGARRLLLSHGFATMTEVSLANGRRADLVAMSERGQVWIIEIKSSVGDFRADHKWPDYREFCDRFYFAVNPAFPQDLLPPDVGLMVADRYGGDFIREAPAHQLVAARRRVLTTKLMRMAAFRLHAIADPELQLNRNLDD